MLLIFKYFLDICLFRANAENAPSSKTFMLVTLTVFGLLSFFMFLTGYPIGKAITAVLLWIAIMVGFVKAALWIKNTMDRSWKTTTAIAGTSIVFDLIYLPLAALSVNYPDGELVFPAFLLYLTIIWHIAVIGNIMKNVLSIPYWAGIFVTLIYAVVLVRVFRIILTTGS